MACLPQGTDLSQDGDVSSADPTSMSTPINPIVGSNVNGASVTQILNRQPRVVVEDVSFSGNAVQCKELNRPDNLHSPSSHLVADRKYLQSLPTKQPIKWPDMSDNDAWTKFENSVLPKLQPISQLQARVNLLESVIYDTGADIFGHPLFRISPTKSWTLRK